MSLNFRPGHRIFVYAEYVDMRSGFNGLAGFVRDQLAMKIEDGDLFLFVGKTRKRIKGLCYDGTGLVLISKRMDHGRVMRLEDFECGEITSEELHLIFRGSVVRREKFGVAALTK